MTEQEALSLLINVTAPLELTRADHGRISEALSIIRRVLIDNETRKEASTQPKEK